MRNVIRQRASELLAGQNRVVEMLAAGAPLADALSTLLQLIETHAPGMLGSVLLLDDDGKTVRVAAAPSLPAGYSQLLDGLEIGPQAGSCGTAAYRREPVFVEDIETDPLWDEYRRLTRPHGLRACWSTPILDAEGSVLGTFAMYYREPGLPSAEHRQLIDIATHIAALGIARDRSERTLAAKVAEMERYFDRTLGLWCLADRYGVFQRLNPAWQQALGYSQQEMQGQRCMDFVHADDREQAVAALSQLTARDCTLDFTLRFRHRDNSYRWIDWRAFSVDGMIYASARDATERRLAQQQLRDRDTALRKSAQQLRSLAQRLERIREDEQTRLARDIHDRLGQSLTLLKLQLGRYLERTADQRPGMRDEGKALLAHVDETIDAVRRIASELRPPLLDDLGLAAGLEWAAERFTDRTRIRCDVELDETAGGAEASSAVYAIVQEALTNVARHAQAAHVAVRLRHVGEAVVLTIHDDGRGFAANPAQQSSSLGLLGMRERAAALGGELQVQSAPGQGTVVTVRFPADVFGVAPS